jgi:Dyp-type peroxidase family
VTGDAEHQSSRRERGVVAQAKGVLPNKEDDREVLYKNPRTCGYFIPIRVRPEVTPEQFQNWLSTLDQAVDALVARDKPKGDKAKGEKLASVAVGLAPTFFDRLVAFGVELERPAGFTPEAAPPTARFGPAPELSADVMFYVAAVMEFRVEALMRYLTASPAIEVLGLERGYQRVDETEPFGYRDGARNVKTSKRSSVVYVHRDGAEPDEPTWADGGTYMVTMKIQQNTAEFASLTDDAARDAVIGRTKDGTRLDLPAGTDPHKESADVPESLPPSSHVRKAGPRGHHDDSEIFRRGMPYVEFVDGVVKVGLQFCSFQATPNQFDAVFNDWMLNQQFPPRADGTVAGPDALMNGKSPSGRPLVEVKHGAIFFVPPYNAEGIAATLTPKKPHKPKTGRLAINKVVIDPTDRSRRFERAGFEFEVHDESGALIEGSHFITASNGRGVCEAELPLGHTYTLVETVSPQPNVALVQQDFTLDKPNLLLRVENAFQAPPLGYGGI